MAARRHPSEWRASVGMFRDGMRRLCRASQRISVAVVVVALLSVDGVPVVRAQSQSDLQAPPSLLNESQARPQWYDSPAPGLAPEQVLAADGAQTLDLIQAYERVMLNDPQVHAARAARDAGLDAENIARAALLPQASINYLRNRTRQTEYVTQPGLLPGMPERHFTTNDRYYGRRAGLSIEQTLFDYSAISTYRMGKTQSEYAEVQFRLQFQQEAVALIDAYLNALLARDSMELARQQLRIYQVRLRDNERMMAQGEGTRIDILETSTEMGATQSELVGYENALGDRLRELSSLLGGPVLAGQLLAIDVESVLPALQSGALATLLNDAQQQNPEIQAARLTVRYNDLTVEREKGQFMPRVSVFAAHDRVASDTVNNQGRDYKTNIIGLQVSIPIFSGGSSYYTTRQARNRLEQSRRELDRTTNHTATLLEQYFRVCATSGERVRTLRSNVADGTELVEAMRKSVAGGERTNTDALLAERRAYEARQELLRTYVEWFQAHAKLQFYAGRFSEDDVLLLNRQLVVQTEQPGAAVQTSTGTRPSSRTGTHRPDVALPTKPNGRQAG